MNKDTQAVNMMMDLSVLQTKLSKKLDAQLSIHGISFNELIIMHHLHQALLASITVSQHELAQTLGQTASNLSRVLQPMERNNILTKIVDVENPRASKVCLTETGLELYKNAYVSANDRAQSLFDGMNPEQKKHLIAATVSGYSD